MCENVKINSLLKNYYKSIIAVILLIITSIIILSNIIIFEVHGASMEPTLFEGDIILINRLFFKKNFKKYDIIIFQRGFDPKYIIKRILGCPYDTVVYENREGTDTLTLNKGEYFMEGDNKDHSTDSRQYGPINRNQIIGKKIIIIKQPKIENNERFINRKRISDY